MREKNGNSLMVQQLELYASISGAPVRFLVQVLRFHMLDFPGDPVVKNPSANAENIDSIPGPGRSHMPRSTQAQEPQLLSPCAATTKASSPRARAPQQEKPLPWEAHALQRVAPALPN